MEIAVCVKPVPEPETRLRVAPDGRTLDPEGVKFVLAGYDESAVEQALLLKESVPGSTVHVLTCGPAPRAEEVLRAAIALGCDRATWVEAPAALAADPVRAAIAIAAVLRSAPADLVLCGKQAGDDEAGLSPARSGSRSTCRTWGSSSTSGGSRLRSGSAFSGSPKPASSAGRAHSPS